MSEHVIKKFKHDELTAILAQLDLSEEAAQLIKEKHTAHEILQTLVNNQLLEQAIKFLALGLPAREAIWWGYIALENKATESEGGPDQNGLALVRSWVHAPEEALRYDAKALSEAPAVEPSIAWLLKAVFWSGESIAAPDEETLAPHPMMSGQAVANAVIVGTRDIEEQETTRQFLIKKGLHIAMGGNGRLTG